MLRRISSIAWIAVLAGCSAVPLEVGSITDIQPAAGIKSAGIYQGRQWAGVTRPESTGDQVLDVRAYTMKNGASLTELAGATCTLTTADVSALLQTPAQVRVQLYGQNSSALIIACEMPGYKKKSVTVAAVDAAREKRKAGEATGGLIGLISVAAIDALADDSKNVWEYPVTKVILLASELAGR